MLYQIGTVQFTLDGLQPHEIEREAGADFAEKDVIGALKPAEPVGEGDDVIKLTCLLYTGFQQQRAGLYTLNALDEMRLAQVPQIMVRGDGTSLGWRRITNISEKGRKLDISGRPKVIAYEITLKKTPMPGVGARLAFLYNLLS